MCQQLIHTTRHMCGHKIDSPGTIMELDRCNNCGNIVRTQHLGVSTKRVPCSDCKANGAYVQRGGKWERA
ncbi:uncharacterized protein BO80DRAFT_420686 [Aspergillus ibericus CBS 121593]|uniref:Uncharacterized protein n=1 Tax=Aspergillus ibericus CBS 121593 TaxID=1448316 RepID=A0A395HF90_9EURO|nr:hypothetical protein BO80DRAFT_420686 [Aspergillus ibericus CBS 121593]RAL06390.1 hypothetical protein BO80DRAFT_420686 [Aspergillus ibericus CBS 121593]